MNQKWYSGLELFYSTRLFTTLVLLSMMLIIFNPPSTTGLSDEFTIHISDVAKFASAALVNSAEISEVLGIDQTKELREAEKIFKSTLLNTLLDKLVDAWARINAMIAKGIMVGGKLKEIAEELVKQIRALGGGDIVKSRNFKDKVQKRIMELLTELYSTVCCKSDWRNGASYVQLHFQNISTDFHADTVKDELITSLRPQLDLFKTEYLGVYERYPDNRFKKMLLVWLKKTIDEVIEEIRWPLIRLQETVEQIITNEAELVRDAMKKSVLALEKSFTLLYNNKIDPQDIPRPSLPDVYDLPSVCNYSYYWKMLLLQTNTC